MEGLKMSLLHPCKDCIVMPICSRICDMVTFDIGYMETTRLCPDCGEVECFQYVAGLYYVVCLWCRSTYYFSIFENEDCICRSTKRDIGQLLSFRHSHITYTTFGYAIDKYKRGDYEL